MKPSWGLFTRVRGVFPPSSAWNLTKSAKRSWFGAFSWDHFSFDMFGPMCSRQGSPQLKPTAWAAHIFGGVFAPSDQRRTRRAEAVGVFKASGWQCIFSHQDFGWKKPLPQFPKGPKRDRWASPASAQNAAGWTADPQPSQARAHRAGADAACLPRVSRWLRFSRSPSSALSHPFFGWEGSPTQIDYRKKSGTLILTSPHQDLVSLRLGLNGKPEQPPPKKYIKRRF